MSKTLRLKKPLTTDEIDALQLKHVTPMPVEPPKQPTYQELEARAVARGLAKLDEHNGDWRRLRRSAGFID